MKRIAFFLFCLLACHSAVGQEIMKEYNIEENVVLEDMCIIKGTPCVGYYDDVPVLLNYKYLGKGETHYLLIEGRCEKQRTWWTVNQGNTAIIKICGGTFQNMIFTEVKSDAVNDRISFVLAVDSDFDKQLLGVTDILFRTSYGQPKSIKIHLDEKSQEHLHKQYLYITAAAHL